MGFKPYTLLIGILCLLLTSLSSSAQNNLVVEYDGALGVPSFLNICGEPDTARMTVRITGLEIEARENIQATVDLFQGARFEEFIAAESDSGISLLSSTLDGAIFSIPDLDPFITSTVELVFTISADCSYLDTINANNQALVVDEWSLAYDLDGSSFTEAEMTADYKDAFAVPNLTISNTNNITIASIGDCFERDIILSNSGLSGFIDSLEYSAVYEAGITVNSVSINGVDYPITKTAVGTDTLYKMTIVGAYLELNTQGAGMGDGDQSLDPDESLIITENICVLSCTEGRESVHDVSWGCYSTSCEVETLNQSVTIGSGAPNPVATNSGTVPNEITGYCQDGSQTVTFTNQGNEVDPGFGTMRDVELGIGLGNNFLLDVERFEIFSITVGGITLTTDTALIRLDSFPEFMGIDPDGPGGLIDLDNDGYFDDLPINESVEVTVGYRFVCSEANSTEESCENQSAESLNSQVFYTNSCGERIQFENNSVIRPSNISPDSESSTDTDAQIATETFHVRYFQLRTVSNFAKACSGGEQMIVTVDLPTGVMINPAETNLFRNTSIAMPLISSTMNGTMATLVYDASISNFISGEFTIDLGLTSDCTAESGPTVFPVTLAHFCPDCNCTHTWFCGDLDGPIMHPSVPPCPNFPPCPNGIRTTAFDVSRTTFGYTDETYTQRVDESTANTKVALTCDSVMMTVTSLVGDDVITNDVGVTISYDNPEEIPGTEEIFLFDGAEVEIRQTNGNIATCMVAASSITVTAVDLNKTLDIELDDCLAGLGLILSPNDTIIFKGMFSLNPDGPYNEQFKLVPNFRGEMYHTFAGDQISCDNYGEAFTVAKTGSLFVTPSSPSFPSGCEESNLDYKVSVFSNDFGVFYPNEFIPAAFVDSMKFTFDPAILEAFEDLSVEVSIPNHPIHGNNFFNIPGLDAFPNGDYVAVFDTLNYIPSYNTSFSAAFTLRVNLVANCGSETASSDGDNIFDFLPEVFYRDRIYAETIGDGSCANYIQDAVNNNIFYTDAPSFALQALSLTAPQVSSDTVQWVLQHCNTSIESDGGLNWISFDIPGSELFITSIVDNSTGTVVDVPFTSYGNGNSVFAYVDPLLKNFSGNSPADICNTYIVIASFNACGTFPLTVRSGWNCTPYDDPNWTPLNYAPCEEETVDLSVTTLEGALDAEVILEETAAVDLCDTLTYEILVRNTDLGDIFSMNNEIFLPLFGLEFVPNSFQLAYPSGGTFSPIPAPDLKGISSRGQAYAYDDFSQISTFLDDNGLQGFNATSPTDSNEYVIRFQVVPGCNYISGEQIPYSFQGVSACGDSTNIEFGATLPIFIQGVPEPTQFFLAEFGATSFYDPAGFGSMEVSVSNITGQMTDANDVIRVILQQGTVYTPNSATATSPAAWIPGEPIMETEDGYDVLYWDMPQGVAQGEEINFTFDYTGTPIAICDTDTLSFNLATLDRYDILCGVTNDVCSIFAETTEGGSEDIDLIVTNGIAFEITSSTSECINDTTEEITVSATIDGLPVLLQDGPIQFYYDVNMDGEGNMADDVLLGTATIPAGTTGTFTITETFTASHIQLCDLIMDLDTTGLGACNDPIPAEINPQLNNAGLDANYCGNSVTLGNTGCAGVSTYTYNWSAIAPATNADISNTNILSPNLTIDPSIPVGTTLEYVLETTRPDCGYSSMDTVSITVQPDLTVSIDDGGVTVVCNGDALSLEATASEAVTFAWSDGTNDLGATATLNTTPSANTTYTVVATNNGGCTVSASVSITIGNGITAIDAGQNETICLGSSTQLQGSATGTGNLTFLWTGDGLDDVNIANPTATPSVTTTYTLEVTDADGCTDTDQVIITVDPNIPNVDANAPAGVCVGLNSTFSATGGTSFTWTEMAANPSTNVLSNLSIANPVFTPTAAGTYNFEVLIAGGCDDITVPVSVVATALQVTTAQADLDQCLADNQAASITLEEDIQSYTINGAAFTNDNVNGNTLTFDAMYLAGAANTYQIELVGVSGCVATTSFNFVTCGCEPAVVTGVMVGNSNCDESTGSATINIAGNPADYTYTWTPDAGTASAIGNSRTGLPAGTYEVSIADIATPSCITTINVIVGNSNGPEPTSIVTTPATCTNANGTATILPADWTYSWSDGGTGNSRTDLLAGLYGVTVTDSNDPTCVNVILVLIEQENDLNISHQVNTDPTCGNNDGSVEILVNGGGGNYTYIWSDGGSGAIRNDLSSGTYLVNVSEAGGGACTDEYVFALTDSDVPQATISIDNINNESCEGSENGSVGFTVTLPAGIVMPVDTIITNGLSEFNNGSLATGQYCIEIRDANGCVNGAICFEVEAASAIFANISTEAACGDGGSVSIEAIGGTGTYFYDWADIPGMNNPSSRTGLTAGNYNLTIFDSNGCSITLDGGINIEPCPCDVEPEIESVTIQEATCGNSDGTATILVNPSPVNLTYTWSPDLGTSVGAGNIRIGLPAGGYTVTVADASGICSDVMAFSVTNSDAPEIDVDIVTTAASCGTASGTATLSPATLEYAWSDSGTGAIRTDLAAGTYFVSVSESGTSTCFSVVEVFIDVDNDIEIDVTTTVNPTCGNADGTIMANVIGGSGNYNYDWSFGGSATATEENIMAGIYGLTVTDANANECTSSEPFLVIDGDVVGAAITIDNIDNVSCNAANDGMVNFTITPQAGFQGPETIVISDGNTIYQNGALPGGSYCIAIYDSNGCVAGGDCFVIEEAEALDAEFSIASSCESDGAIDIIVIHGSGNYTYDWADLPGSDDPEDRENLEAGIYNVTITDGNGCTIVGSNLEILCNDCDYEPEVISTMIFEATCGNNDGEVMININADPALAIFTWSPDLGTPGITPNIRTNLPAGGYTVTVAEPQGNCTTTISFAITNEDAPSLDDEPVVTPADCGGANGTATLSPDTYTYTWPDNTTGATRSDLAAGTYFVTYEDADPACQGFVEVTIGTNNILEVEVTVDTAPTCGNADGAVTAVVSNGSGDYSYIWSFGGSNASQTGLASGTYQLTVTDNNSPECTASTAVVLIDSDVTQAEVIITEITNETCAGAANGAVTFTVNPSAGLDIVITDGTNTYESGFIPVGEYCIEVRDAAGCVTGGDCFTIEAAEPLDVEFSISGGCNGDGAINVIANGGTGNFTYDWLDIPGEINDEDRSNLMTGVYSVVVTDENDCAVFGFELPIECDACDNDIINYTIGFESDCGLSIGSAEVVVNGDVADYSFDWSPIGVGTTSTDGNQLTDLPAGAYNVVVTNTDNPECRETATILVTNENAPNAEIESITPSLCGQATGTIALTPDTLTYLWEDGTLSATRNDLEAGQYVVTYFNDLDTACINVLLVEIEDTTSLEINVDIDQLPDCGIANGGVSLNISGGSGNYDYQWSDGSKDQIRTNLMAGTYVVIVTDNDTGCSNELTFTLDNSNAGSATINITDVNGIACEEQLSGSVVFDVTYDAGFIQPALVTVTDGFTQYSPTALPEGSYCINVIDGNGCLVASECFDIRMVNGLELSIIGTYAGCEGTDELGAFNVTVAGGTAPYNYDWADITGTNNEEDRDSLAFGLYDLTVTDANGCMTVANNIGLDTFCLPICEYFDGMDTMTINTMNCEDTILLCTGLDFNEYLTGDFEIMVDGAEYIFDANDACESFTFLTYNFIFVEQSSTGPYDVQSWDVGGSTFSGSFNDVNDLVNLMNTWDPNGNWELSPTANIIVGGNPGVTYGDMVIIPVATGLPLTLNASSGSSVSNVGVNVFGGGIHEIVILDNETQCPDTLIVNIVCDNYMLFDTLMLGDSTLVCLDVIEIIDNTNLEGNIISLENACPEESGESVVFTIVSEDPPCISYLGITPGMDTACLVFCDDLGICDTVDYIVTVEETGPLTVYDTILVGQSDTICLDSLTNLAGDIVSVTDFCDDDSPEVEFEIIDTGDDFCIVYEGLELGIDSTCLEITDEYGNTDTVIIVIQVNEITTDTICDTMFVGQVVQYCLDQTELQGNITSITNECMDQSGEFVEFFLEDGNWCVTYEGVDDVGTDSACIILCDDLGVCDTTIFCVTVVEFFDPPIAVDDYDTTQTDVPIVINVKANDTIFGGIDTLYIIDPPQVGTVTANLDCTLTYEPDEGVCSVEDQFTYVVCNPNACDTATVYIYIECTNLTIFNGFSPNGDGVNDEFWIDGIEDYPNNRLCIYNRWGEKVYEKDGYNNEWFGVWDGYDLPDGTYFYVLDLGDENRTKYNGYVQIFR